MPVDVGRYQQAATAAAGRPTQLVRVGSAVLFRAGQYALRVTGQDVPAADVRMEAQLAQWLSERHINVIPVLDVSTHGPLTVAVMPWCDTDRPTTTHELVSLLSQLHQLHPPEWLRTFDPLAVTRTRLQRLRQQQAVSDAEQQVVEPALKAAETVWLAVQHQGGPAGVVHGDCTVHNVLVSDATPLLHDFENAGTGPIVWDLARKHHGALRFHNTGGTTQFIQQYEEAAGHPIDRTTLDRLVPVVDIIGAVWCLAGRQLDPGRFTTEAAVRLQTVASERPRGCTWNPR